MITVDNVFLKYPAAKEDTINGISFSVRECEIFGFLGPSGAGKSTLQKILTGVLRGYRGSVSVLGTEVKHRDNTFYENIGVDFEFPNFYGKCSAIENLNFFSSLYNRKPLPAMELLEKVGLKEDAEKRVSDYSKGMKMRLGFVRALLHNPKLLFLDEPTSGLDPSSARTMKNMILEEKQKGKTIILTTHNMHDAEELCDRVAFVVEGKVKAMDTPEAFRMQTVDTKVLFAYKDGDDISERTTPLRDLNADSVFQKVLKEGTLQSIHTKEQTLEDVFISLTGRCLT